jgi:hypothetical protein
MSRTVRSTPSLNFKSINCYSKSALGTVVAEVTLLGWVRANEGIIKHCEAVFERKF